MDSTTLIVVCAAGVVLLVVVLFVLRGRGKKDPAAVKSGATEKATADSKPIASPANQEPPRVPAAKATPVPTAKPTPLPTPAPVAKPTPLPTPRPIATPVEPVLEAGGVAEGEVTAPLPPGKVERMHAEAVRAAEANFKLDLSPPSQQDEATQPLAKKPLSAPRVEAPRRPETAGDTKPLVPRVEDRKLAPSAPKVDAAKPSAPKVDAAKVDAAKVEDRKPASAPKVETAKAEPKAAPAKDAPRPAETRPATPQARLGIPSNPATAELEKNDPRHAGARRFARVAVSEIKLYHEEEVATGRASKDLWTRLHAEITLARQTYDGRVDKEVRERFDYLYDEIIRQLAEGEIEKLGPEAPKPKAPVVLKPESDAKLAAPAIAEDDAADVAQESLPMEEEAPTRKHALLEDRPEPTARPAAGAEPPVAAPAAPATAKPGAKYAPPTSAETAELEKGDPRHAAARRFARLAVSEIKLYHEDEVAAGRAAKDLWTRLQADISLARQTYDGRVDKEVRERFDYLYDEILRQLAEGEVEKLGPGAPKPKTSERNVPAAAPPAPSSQSSVSASAVSVSETGAAAARVHGENQTTLPSPLNRYAPPVNPATAELEKNDPRHAAARRLARLSISEIKLYHEDEVKQGREARDLWKRFSSDIALATQTFDKRVDKDVRERFDYLYDEIVRQLAEGDIEKLGAEAPKRALS